MKNLFYFILLSIALPVFAQEDKLYHLKANDSVKLTVFREPDLTATEQLTAAGEVSFPLIGSVRLLGLTIAEAEALVTSRYDADYLVSPSLSINVINAADEIISVLGAVENPGQQNIAVNETLDLVTALDSAGGLAAHADPTRIELKRDDQTLTFDLDELRAPGATQIILQHGDRINVPASLFANKTVTILGEVANPGVEDFPVNGKLTLDVLVAKRGGPTDVADTNRITVKRNGQVFSGIMGRGQILVPGDLVTVPPSRFAGKFVTVEGSVNRPGKVPFDLDGSFTLLEAIGAAGGFTRLARETKVRVIRNVGGKQQVFEKNCKDIKEGKAPRFPLQPGDRINVRERIF